MWFLGTAFGEPTWGVVTCWLQGEQLQGCRGTRDPQSWEASGKRGLNLGLTKLLGEGHNPNHTRGSLP